MKYSIAIIIGIVTAALFAWLFIGEKSGVTVLPNEDNGSPDFVRVTTAYGFSYTYLKDEYRVYESADAPSGNLVHTQMIIDADDYDDRSSDEALREDPVSLTIAVYRNPMNIDTREWITQTDASNYKLSPDGTIHTVQLGDTEYLSYQFDGLYRADAYVYGEDGYIYVFSNMWDNPESAMKKDMEAVIASIEWSLPRIPASAAHGDIVIETPTPNGEVSSPLVVEGKARGGWYFEATFPVIVVDWDGRIIGEGYAEALGDWMTEDYVPFRGEVIFETPEGDNRGSVILKKSNASGLPEHDDAIELPIILK